MFEGKVAVITGAGSGIGRELARQLAAEGARLALSDVSAAGLAETARLVGSAPLLKTYALDVSSRAAVFAHADDVKRDFGAAHFVFNNAGVSLAATIEHATIEEIEWLLSINLWGVIYGTKAFLPLMLAQKEGCIVNISSVFGLVAIPTQGLYHIAKFGVRGMTECLWRELEGTGVRAVSVHPGGIKTSIAHSAPMGKNAGALEAEYTAKVGRALVTPAADCAADIIKGIARGKNRIVTGSKSGLLDLLPRLFPSSYGKVLKSQGF
jgi:NAD(P)-dependent dehydrogenase (short-subunit alcohol dehydrogenase family)